MTAHPASSVDWLAAYAGNHRYGYAAKWAAAAVGVAGAAAGAVALVLWLDAATGSQNAPDAAVLIDMVPLPEAPPAIATLEPAPEVPMAELPDSMAPVAQNEPLPDVADPELAPDLPEPMLAPDPLLADLPPDAEAPPEPPKPAPVPEPVPEKQPAPKKQKVEKTKPKVTAKTEQQPVTEQKAATAVSKGKVKSLKDRWGAQIRKKIERRKSYPRAAAGNEGAVGVRLTVSRGGGLAGVSVVRSSGNAALDAAAVQAVNRAGGFPAAPDALTDGQYSFTLTIAFKK